MKNTVFNGTFAKPNKAIKESKETKNKKPIKEALDVVAYDKKTIKEAEEPKKSYGDKVREAIDVLKGINPDVFYVALGIYEWTGETNPSDDVINKVSEYLDGVDTVYDEYVRGEVQNMVGKYADGDDFPTDEDDDEMEFFGDSGVDESLAKKPIKETWEGNDIIDDLVDRAQGIVNEGADKEEAVTQAIDEGLIYYKDIYALLEHYGSIDSGEIIESYYDDLYNDIYSELEDSEDTEDDEDEDEE